MAWLESIAFAQVVAEIEWTFFFRDSQSYVDKIGWVWWLCDELILRNPFHTFFSRLFLPGGQGRVPSSAFLISSSHQLCA